MHPPACPWLPPFPPTCDVPYAETSSSAGQEQEERQQQAWWQQKVLQKAIAGLCPHVQLANECAASVLNAGPLLLLPQAWAAQRHQPVHLGLVCSVAARQGFSAAGVASLPAVIEVVVQLAPPLPRWEVAPP